MSHSGMEAPPCAPQFWFLESSSLCFLSCQKPPRKRERPAWTFGATAGGGQTWDDEGSIGKGWLVGGYIDRRISTHVDFELGAK